MFTMKSTILLTLLALSSNIIAATPPACLLAAVNTEKDPGALDTVCGNDATKVQSAIASLCSGSNASAAQTAFIATCSGAGKSVASYTATATSKPTGSSSYGSYVYTTQSYNSSCSCTQTVVMTTTGAIGSATATGSGSASASSGAAVGGPQGGSFAAVAIAIAGVVAVL